MTQTRTTAKQRVHGYLRQEILGGNFPGGTRLIQADIAASLGVSTTPVREALHDLASEGLVLLGPHKGAMVNQLAEDDLHEVFELRRLLEPRVMRLAIPKLTPPILSRLEGLCERMEDTAITSEWVHLNREFHGVFMETTGWPRLAAFVGALHDSACPFVALALRFGSDLMEVGNRDHRDLVAAANQGDVEAAVSIAVDHMNATRDGTENKVPGEPGTIRGETLQ